jgi:hypothetical protein
MDRVSVDHEFLEFARTRTANATKDLRGIVEQRKKCVAKLKAHTDADGRVEAKKLKH